jgi:FKBP-type peptidyl-prolyl cis-trans isomerase FklB
MSSPDGSRVCSLAGLAVAACLFTAASSAQAPQGPADEERKLGYSVGYQVGSDFRRQGISIDADRVVRGVRDALSGVAPELTPEEMRAALIGLRRQAEAAAREQRDEQARRSLEAGANAE